MWHVCGRENISLTLEASLAGSDKGKHYSLRDLEGIGASVGQARLNFCCDGADAHLVDRPHYSGTK